MRRRSSRAAAARVWRRGVAHLCGVRRARQHNNNAVTMAPQARNGVAASQTWRAQAAWRRGGAALARENGGMAWHHGCISISAHRLAALLHNKTPLYA
jgi:hypothetical protein